MRPWLRVVGLKSLMQDLGTRQFSWKMHAVKPESTHEEKDSILRTSRVWCEGPSNWAAQANASQRSIVAAWPSSVLALPLLFMTAKKNTGRGSAKSYSTLVGDLCDSSEGIARFRVQLHAQATLMDNKHRVALTTLLVENSDSLFFGAGYSYHVTLKVGNHCFDVLNWERNRGVCEVLVCTNDVKKLRGSKPRLCITRLGTRVETPELSAKTVSTEGAVPMMRVLTEEEKCALQGKVLPELASTKG